MSSDVRNQKITASNFPQEENDGVRRTMRGEEKHTGLCNAKRHTRLAYLPNRWIEVFKTFFKNKNAKPICKPLEMLLMGQKLDPAGL
jgi:hypothetical protein